jgi:hypothetical protein
MSRSLFAFALAFSLLAGCAADVDIAPDEGPPLEEDEGAFVTDTAVTNVDLYAPELSTVRVRAGVLTVWIDPHLRTEVRDNRVVHIVRGRTSRKLKELSTFIHDDGFGDARIINPTTFEVIIRSDHELNSMLAGLPLFLRFVAASGVPNEHQAQLVIAPRLVKIDGPASVRFDAPLTPIATRDGGEGVRYRGRVFTTQTTKWLSVEVEDSYPSARLSARVFRFDLWYHDLHELTDTLLVARAQFASGQAITRAHVELVVASIGLTTKSAELTWPRVECSPAIDACVAALGDARDLGSCGTYRQVHACLDVRTR